MTLDEFLKQVRERARRGEFIRSDDFGHSTEKLRDWCEQELDALCAFEIPRLLAIIEAQRAEIKKAERVVGTLVAHDSFPIVEAAGQAVATEHFGGNAAIAEKFERGGL